MGKVVRRERALPSYLIVRSYKEGRVSAFYVYPAWARHEKGSPAMPPPCHRTLIKPMRSFYINLHASCCNQAALHESNANLPLEIKRREALVVFLPR